jgi:hypothetical protein
MVLKIQFPYKYYKQTEHSFLYFISNKKNLGLELPETKKTVIW